MAFTAEGLKLGKRKRVPKAKKVKAPKEPKVRKVRSPKVKPSVLRAAYEALAEGGWDIFDAVAKRGKLSTDHLRQLAIHKGVYESSCAPPARLHPRHSTIAWPHAPYVHVSAHPMPLPTLTKECCDVNRMGVNRMRILKVLSTAELFADEQASHASGDGFGIEDDGGDDDNEVAGAAPATDDDDATDSD